MYWCIVAYFPCCPHNQRNGAVGRLQWCRRVIIWQKTVPTKSQKAVEKDFLDLFAPQTLSQQPISNINVLGISSKRSQVRFSSLQYPHSFAKIDFGQLFTLIPPKKAGMAAGVSAPSKIMPPHWIGLLRCQDIEHLGAENAGNGWPISAGCRIINSKFDLLGLRLV